MERDQAAGNGGGYETLASEHDSHCTHELTAGVAAYTRPAQDCMHQHFMDKRAL